MAKKLPNSTEESEAVMFFMEDAMFYALWKYAQPALDPATEYVDFEKLAPVAFAPRLFEFLSANLKKAGVSFRGLHIYNDVNDKDINLPPSEDRLKGYSEKEKKQILASAQRIIESKHGDGCSQEDVLRVLPIAGKFFDYIYFYTNIPKEDQEKLKPVLQEYIRSFMNDMLLVYDRNYLTFEQQKQHFFKKIRDMDATKKYGINFVIIEEITGSMQGSTEFLFIHTLYALQRLGYLTIIRLWHGPGGFGSAYKFHANVALQDKYFEEVSDTYKTKHPSIHFEKLDEKRGILVFAGKQISVSKGGKETYPMQLLQTLKKEKDRYWFEDEILTDWGHNDEEQKRLPKNRVYHAALKVNNLVARATQIDDFLEHNTEKFRINPKYLKSS